MHRIARHAKAADQNRVARFYELGSLAYGDLWDLFHDLFGKVVRLIGTYEYTLIANHTTTPDSQRNLAVTGTSVCSWRTGDYTIIVCVRAGHILLVCPRNVTGTE